MTHYEIAMARRRRGARLCAGLAAGLLVAGCVGAQTPAPALVRQSATVERGMHVAQLRCASCHATGSTGPSPSAMAPPFRALRMRYNPISLERHINDIAASGYYEMPGQSLSDADARDVAAYIETLHQP